MPLTYQPTDEDRAEAHRCAHLGIPVAETAYSLFTNASYPEEIWREVEPSFLAIAQAAVDEFEAEPPTPFGHPRYHLNRRDCRGDETPCGYCGNPVASPWGDAVRVVDGGAKFAPRDAPGEDAPGEMGCWGLHPECSEKLKKHGVPVFAWNGTVDAVEKPA